MEGLVLISRRLPLCVAVSGVELCHDQTYPVWRVLIARGSSRNLSIGHRLIASFSVHEGHVSSKRNSLTPQAAPVDRFQRMISEINSQEGLFRLHGETDGHIRCSVKRLKNVIAEQTAEFAL